MGSLLTARPTRPLIAPSILAADFARMGEACMSVLAAGADLLHLDVMDGHFVPNLTMGPDLCRAVRRVAPAAFLDVHLMVTEPSRFVGPFVDAGANHVTFHVEVMPPAEAERLADRVRALGATAGLAINPPTDPGALLEIADAFDMILVMSVNPGFAGQAFIAPVLEKTRLVAPRLRESQRLEMDGGIGVETAGSAIAAGADVLVAGSAVFGLPQDRWRERIEALRRGG